MDFFTEYGEIPKNLKQSQNNEDKILAFLGTWYVISEGLRLAEAYRVPPECLFFGPLLRKCKAE
jgi:hypothetical protein